MLSYLVQAKLISKQVRIAQPKSHSGCRVPNPSPLCWVPRRKSFSRWRYLMKVARHHNKFVRWIKRCQDMLFNLSKTDDTTKMCFILHILLILPSQELRRNYTYKGKIQYMLCSNCRCRWSHWEHMFVTCHWNIFISWRIYTHLLLRFYWSSC